jgi:hypothetical protein
MTFMEASFGKRPDSKKSDADRSQHVPASKFSLAMDNGIDWVNSRTKRCEPRVFTLRKPVFRKYKGPVGTAHSPLSDRVANA